MTAAFGCRRGRWFCLIRAATAAAGVIALAHPSPGGQQPFVFRQKARTFLLCRQAGAVKAAFDGWHSECRWMSVLKTTGCHPKSWRQSTARRRWFQEGAARSGMKKQGRHYCSSEQSDENQVESATGIEGEQTPHRRCFGGVSRTTEASRGEGIAPLHSALHRQLRYVASWWSHLARSSGLLRMRHNFTLEFGIRRVKPNSAPANRFGGV
jgi:hypothetical protein